MEQFILELVAYLYALIGIETKLDFISPPKSPTNTDLTLGQEMHVGFHRFISIDKVSYRISTQFVSQVHD
jgi:hypothetical protein